MKKVLYLGLDVHGDTIAAAVAEADGRVIDLGVIEHSDAALRKLVRKLAGEGEVRACYEAGPTGYGVYRLLLSLGVDCVVVAPGLIPRSPTDRVKTDRRDARKLATLHRAGMLTSVWVPDEQHEALRDLVRAREAAVQDRLRARNRLTKFLLHHSIRPPEKAKPWNQKYRVWLSSLRFEHLAAEHTFADYLQEVEHAKERLERLEAAIDEVIATLPPMTRRLYTDLQALRGVGPIASITLVAEVGRFSRFRRAPELMAYCGLVPREHSSGERIRRGGITKTGNTHLRRILVEAAWALPRKPGGRPPLRGHVTGISPTALETGRRAQERLHRRFWRLVDRGKDRRKAIVAIARELVAFAWDIGVDAERSAA